MSNRGNDIPEGFKVTELGLLPEDWEVVQVDEVIKLSRGISWSKSEESAVGVPVVAIPNVREGRVNFNFHYRISKNISDEKTLRSGDILLVGSSGGVHNVGRTALVQEIPFPKLTFASFLVKASPSVENIDHSFSFHLLCSGLIDYAACSKRAADGKFNLQVDEVRHFPIPLPPLPEQKAIARVLSTIQRAIEAQDKIIAAAKELKKSLMRHLFTYGLVRVAEAEHVLLQETEIGPLPERWEVVKLGEVVDMKYGYRTSIPKNPPPNGIKIISTADILKDGQLDLSRIRTIEMPEHLIDRYKVAKDDLLFNWRNAQVHVGKTALLEIDPKEPMVFASFLIRIRTKEQILYRYLHFLLNYYRSKGIFFKLSRRAVNQANYNANELGELEVLIPPISEQEEIARILLKADEKIMSEENRRAALQALFKTMLHQLMTGKVRVKDLEVTAA